MYTYTHTRGARASGAHDEQVRMGKSTMAMVDLLRARLERFLLECSCTWFLCGLPCLQRSHAKPLRAEPVVDDPSDMASSLRYCMPGGGGTSPGGGATPVIAPLERPPPTMIAPLDRDGGGTMSGAPLAREGGSGGGKSMGSLGG